MFRDSPIETIQVDPHRVMAATKTLREDMDYTNEVMENGIHNSLLMIYLSCTNEFQKAMFANAQDHDMLKVRTSEECQPDVSYRSIDLLLCPVGF